MSGHDPGDGGGSSARLAEAVTQLREHTDEGWVRVRPSVLDRLRGALRLSSAVRGRTPDGTEYTVSSEVLVARLRARLDDGVRLATSRVALTTGDDDVLTSVAVHAMVLFGTSIIEAAADVRAATRAELDAVLGEAADTAEIIVDVLVNDVTDDPADL